MAGAARRTTFRTWRRRLVGMTVTALAGVSIAWGLWLQAALGRFQPIAERQLSMLAGGADVRWARSRVTPWGSVVLFDVRVTPPGPIGSSGRRPPGASQPRLTVPRLIIGYRWQDLNLRHRGTDPVARVRQVILDRPQLTLGEMATGLVAPSVPPVMALTERARRLAPEPVRLVVTGASIATPGQAPLLTSGRLLAEWRDGQVTVHRAEIHLLGTVLRATGTLTGIATADPQWRFHVHLAGHSLSGQFDVSGRLKASAIRVGAFQAVGGVVDWAQRRWSLTLAATAGGLVTVQGSLTDWQHPQCDITVTDLRIGPLTVSTTAHLATTRVARPGADRVLEGTLTTSGSTMNGQASGELLGLWALAPEILAIEALQLGDHYRLSGVIGVAPPHPLTLTLELSDVDAARVAAMIEPGKSPMASGTVHGHVEITGTADTPRLRGYLGGRDGKIGTAPFQTATINFEGERSIIRLLDSRIRQLDTMVIMEGSVDLSRLGTQRVFEHVRMIPQAHLRSWREPGPAPVSRAD